MRLLVVRCLVFVVVQALMRKRVNAGALVTAGRTKAAFKSMAGLSVCFPPSASVCSGADSVCSGNWEGRMSAVCLGALC